MSLTMSPKETTSKPQRLPMRSKAEKVDDSIMGTNNSSIVSKRSVEYIYFPHEPHFFRYFVKKRQRRAPLINRGYWLRMRAVDHAVQQFLSRPSRYKKVVINLGCGYDPLPWQCLTRYPALCVDTLFLDIDYMDLMRRKCAVVKETGQLHASLTNLDYPQSGCITLKSDQYVQLGCDLRDLSKLSQLLPEVIDLADCSILFTAEVSITYMDQKSADALIKWAATLPHVSFALLEQIIPAGAEHPFARTMFAHFEKLQTPLHSVRQYPTTAHQKVRFLENGWHNVDVEDLWALWSSPSFLTSAERRELDDVEPFDEWEEFSIFGRHYFLLQANNHDPVSRTRDVGLDASSSGQPTMVVKQLSLAVAFQENPKNQGYRRFASALPIRGSHRQRDLAAAFGGMGTISRVNTWDVYSPSPAEEAYFGEASIGPSTRMCHTITPVNDEWSLLIGGRTSPDTALADCWLYHKWTNTWERVDDLPKPLYRHCAVAIGGNSILLIGGKTNMKSCADKAMHWSRRRGWVTCTTQIRNPRSNASTSFSFTPSSLTLFGASMATTGEDCGVIAGGINEAGIISSEIFSWKLDMSQNVPALTITVLSVPNHISAAFTRFGACALFLCNTLFLVGGVSQHEMLQAESEVNAVRGLGSETPLLSAIPFPKEARPLLIGMTCLAAADSILIAGGGMVCFSFGTFWNKGCYSISLGSIDDDDDDADESSVLATSDSQESLAGALFSWRYSCSKDVSAPASSSNSTRVLPTPSNKLVPIPRIQLQSSERFAEIVQSSRPVILHGLELGSCVSKWSAEYLKEKIGVEREVVIHSSVTEKMDFNTKNFDYITTSFGDFMNTIKNGGHVYLRALSAEKSTELPAILERDFPDIADDFVLPPELKIASNNIHSSPLRISGPVNMWLHYDVMANVLCQVRGSKRLLLFPPTDVTEFDLAPGASSISCDVFGELHSPSLAHTNPHEAYLQPGEVLFIPPLWFHSAAPTDGLSVAVNIFFRDLQTGYAPGRDVYGNRDLQAYEKCRQDINRLQKSFANLPSGVREFYLYRLARELTRMA